MEERTVLASIKKFVEQKMLEHGFELENMSIEIVEDGNDIACITVKVLPEKFLLPEEKEINETFQNIIGEL
jgi:hypothetical protein